MSTKKIKSFIKSFIAVVTGDDATALGEKVYRQAVSGLNVQIASLNGDTVALEDKVTETKEALASARVNNGKLITDRSQYVQNLLNAKNKVTSAEEALEEHEAKLVFLKGELAKLDEEEDVEVVE